jgi:hypothetical protein
MGWFNKKEKVPEIPPASRIPELPPLPETTEKHQDLPELPSFNNVNAGEQFNNAIIKSAVQDSSEEKEVSVEELPQNFNFPVPDEDDSATQVKKTLELSSPPTDKPISRQNEPIFVRIDKFQDAKKDFEEIKRKMKDIETILRKVKEVKTKEDAEITGWTDELEKVKARLSEIDENFFNKM